MTYTLDKLVFNFIPENTPAPDISQEGIDQVTADDIYRGAYRSVYNEWPRHTLGKHWQAAIANAKNAQTDFKTFCLYVIAGYMVSHEHTPFFPVNLSATSSIEKLEGFRKACKRKFNSSDARSLGLMLNLEFFDIDDEMLRSETAFGRYITGLVGHEKSADIPYFVYDHDEISFSPYWLAIEDTYHKEVFRPFVDQSMKVSLSEKKTLGNPAQLRHRHLVSQVISALKRRSHLASTIFSSRSRIMPKAVRLVLDHHGIKPTAPISETVNVEDAFEFWLNLGSHIKEA